LKNGKSYRHDALAYGHSTRQASKTRRTPRRAMRAVSSLGRFNESAQSNQQDLIGEMETNRQQEPACGKESLVGGVADQRRQVIQQRCGECLERRDKPITDCAVRGDNAALAPLAVLRPMMRMTHPSTGALTIRRPSTLSRDRAIPAIAGVRMVRAAAHRQGELPTSQRSRCGTARPYNSLFTLYSLSAMKFRNLQPNPLARHWWGAAIQLIVVIVS